MTTTPPPRRATYRLQLNRDFGFDAAAAVAPYLAELGVSHLYSSPWLQAVTGSTHGYDVVDHGRVSEDLGGSAGHGRLSRQLADVGLGVLLDIVPNHMAITGRANAWWWDVLENGPASLYAGYFDVDWDPPDAKLHNRVLLPILPDHYGRVLEAGELVLRRDGGGLIVTYADHEMPVAPPSLGPVLAAALQRTAGDAAGAALTDLLADVGRLPPSWFTDQEQAVERHRAKDAFLRRFADTCENDTALAAAVDAEAAAISGDPDRLDALLENQNYRLGWWRTGADELDYRRFFDISSLVGVRQEDPRVFLDSHQLVLAWLAHGAVDGVRVDHVDGLRDPKGYLDRLAKAAPGRWVVVEKILGPEERLPVDWPVAGTTGYEWLNLVGGLFVDPAGEQPLTQAYERFTGRCTAWEDLEYEAKLEVLRDQFVADLRRLTRMLVTVCESHRRYRDYAWRELEHTLEVVLACFPVYRTYSRVGAHPSAADRDVLGRALDSAIARDPALDRDLLQFIRSILLLETSGGPETELALRVQQLSSAVAAKGVEDTAFYRYLRLSSLNEVGGDPSRFGTGLGEFHRFASMAQEEHPYGLLATSTHDTKRSEDVRARLAVLSEVRAAWAVEVDTWARAAARHKVDGWPDANTEWLWYQTLTGAWPLTQDRAVAYMEKASKEAKVHTSWTRPDAAFDAALPRFIAACFEDASLMASVGAFVESIAGPGYLNALSQKLVTMTAPGVPDIYQGTELWDFSLVDPDNRRPVDFDERRRMLAGLDHTRWEATLAEGPPKMLVVARALAVRRAHPDWFGDGDLGRYDAIDAAGPAADHVVAFARGRSVVTVAPRLTVGLARAGGWAATTIDLPPGTWRDQFTGADHCGTVGLAALLEGFPVALLVRDA